MDKKKSISSELQSWHWFIPLFAVVFVMFSFILSGNSYASIDYNDFISALDYCDQLNNSNRVGNPSHDIIDEYLETYDNFIISRRNDGVYWITFGYQFYFTTYVEGYNTFYVFNSTNMSNGVLRMGSKFVRNPTTSWSWDPFYDTLSTINVNSIDNYMSTSVRSGNIYSDSSLNTILYESNFIIIPPVPPNTITLQAGLNSFHRFQNVGDKQQLIVYLNGYVTEDFTFFVEQYVDNEWQIITDINDYYFLYNEEDNDIYRNPYYITFTYLSGLPAGTCRYAALLNDNPETAFYSDTFTITPWSIGNDATGTVDSNGDIDITVDTGNTVEGIADFLSQEPTVTEQQFNDNFPTVEVDDPSEDFFSWIFDQIENIFTSTTAQTLQFELFGTTYSYSSNDVYVPNNTLKTMIGLSCDFSICMWIIKDVRKVINKIKEGNIEALSDEDITANMV